MNFYRDDVIGNTDCAATRKLGTQITVMHGYLHMVLVLLKERVLKWLQEQFSKMVKDLSRFKECSEH